MLCKHLRDCHRQDLHRLADEELQPLGLYVCRECEDYVCASEKRLETHSSKNHRKKRSTNNHDIMSKFLYGPANHNTINHWEEGLAFLHLLDPEEPTFRQSLITKVHGRTEDLITSLALDLIEATNEANKSPTAKKIHSKSEFDATPFWLLVVLLEQLVLFPSKKANEIKEGSLHAEISRRVRLFRSGQIKQLYQESKLVTSKSAADFGKEAPKIQKSAQSAADNDNFKSAIARLVKNLPIAQITDGENGNIGTLHKLHPPSLNLPCTNNTRVTRGSKLNRKRVHISPKMVMQGLRGLNKGKAGGLQADSLDLFIKLARNPNRGKKKKTQFANKRKTLAHFFTSIANGEVPEKIG